MIWLVPLPRFLAYGGDNDTMFIVTGGHNGGGGFCFLSLDADECTEGLRSVFLPEVVHRDLTCTVSTSRTCCEGKDLLQRSRYGRGPHLSSHPPRHFSP